MTRTHFKTVVGVVFVVGETAFHPLATIGALLIFLKHIRRLELLLLVSRSCTWLIVLLLFVVRDHAVLATQTRARGAAHVRGDGRAEGTIARRATAAAAGAKESAPQRAAAPALLVEMFDRTAQVGAAGPPSFREAFARFVFQDDHCHLVVMVMVTVRCSSVDHGVVGANGVVLEEEAHADAGS